MDTRLLPTTLDGKLDHVIEECAEVTKTICKCRRFGFEPHTFDGVAYDDRAHLLAEIRDLHGALGRLEIELTTVPFELKRQADYGFGLVEDEHRG